MPCLFLLIALAGSVWIAQPAGARAPAPFAGCLEEFANAQPPRVASPERDYALCSGQFATLYAAQTETPVYSAEHLTAAHVEAAMHLRRRNAFHEDARLPVAVATTSNSYRRSGYDRGHMAPSGDEPDEDSQYQSFALSNMVPQNPDDNRRLWAGIEAAVRTFVLTTGDGVYVVTGPLFTPDRAVALRGRIQVPVLLYKAVYDPDAGLAGVYLARNAPGREYWLLSLAEFSARYQIQPFPGLPAQLQSIAGPLPRPIFGRHGNRGWSETQGARVRHVGWSRAQRTHGRHGRTALSRLMADAFASEPDTERRP